MIDSQSQSGFTLIETILYIALFVLIMGSVLLATYNMIETSDKSQYRSLIHNEAQFGIRKMHWLLNGATAVAAINSGAGLQITNPALSGSNIVMQRDGDQLVMLLDGDTIELSGEIAPVTELNFVVTAPPSPATRPTEVEMTFRMQNKYYDETFIAQKLLR